MGLASFFKAVGRFFKSILNFVAILMKLIIGLLNMVIFISKLLYFILEDPIERLFPGIFYAISATISFMLRIDLTGYYLGSFMVAIPIYLALIVHTAQ